MSMPSIPNLDPAINIDRDDAINIILSSIGMEELSLAHLLNAEAEKIQYALGTLETANGTAATFDQILETNRSAGKMVRDVIKNQMLLAMKMEDTVDLAQQIAAANTTPDPEPEPEAEAEPAPEAETTTKSESAAEAEPAPEPEPETAEATA